MNQSINRNILWAQIFADRLIKAGIKNILISPGSRNTPLIFVLSNNKFFNIKLIVDERTSGFFALGIANATKTPSVIVTTSGTAVAELYPSIVEAYQQRIPLIVCTADRPSKLKNTGANQTINQINIYRNHIRKFYNAGLPSVSPLRLKNFAKNIDNMLDICATFNKGPVHINFPFEKPFEPDSYTDKIDSKIFEDIFNLKHNLKTLKKSEIKFPKKFISELLNERSGIIFCGGGNFSNGFRSKLTKLSEMLNYPIIADGTSPLRMGKFGKKNIIVNATAFLRSPVISKTVAPKIILQFGKAPTSNSLLQFIKNSSAEIYSVDEFGDMHDPSRKTKHIFKIIPEEFLNLLIKKLEGEKIASTNFKKQLLSLEKFSEKNKSNIIYNSHYPFEGRIINEIINSIPNNSNLFISNSTPVRDLDFFAPKTSKNISIFTNRGASGIDGIVSTSLGIAAADKKPAFLVIGDLALYHDINSLQITKEYNINLKIILVDNNGGGIFNMLPVAEYKTVFNKFFNTKLNIDFAALIKGFGCDYFPIKSWKNLSDKLSSGKSNSNVSVLHIKTDSKKSLSIRQKYWDSVAKNNQHY